MVSVLASSAIDRGFEPDQVKPKTMKLVCVASPLSTQHEGERAKIQNQDNVSELGKTSIRGLLFQRASTKNSITRVGLVQSGPHHHLIEN